MRNALAIRLAGAATIGALAIACSVSTTSSPYPDVSSFCSAVAKAECQDNTICAVDETQCETWRTSVCQQDAASAQGSGRTYKSDNAKACIDALNSAFGNGASKVTYQQLYGSGSITDKCERVFVGNAGNLATCQTSYDCTDSSEVCASVPGGMGSVCAKPTPKNVGDACADPGDQCADGSYCSMGGGIPKCVAAAADGAPCPSGVACVSSDFCSSGTCMAKSGPGGACTQDSDCNSQAPFCDPYAGHICTIGLTFATGAPDCKGYFLGSGVTDAGAGDGGGNDAGAGDGGGSDAGATDGPTPA